MKIAHISKYRRFGPQGTHTGGVAKFAWYLQRAIPELEIFAWEDFPDWQEYELKAKDWERAPLLNAWLLEEGHIDRDTIAVVDGFWGLGLEGKVKRLISVCHGSFAGAMVEHMKNPWDNGFLLGQSVRHQEAFWRSETQYLDTISNVLTNIPICEIVAVSLQAQGELKLLSGLDSTLILNGIDLSIFNSGRTEKKKGLILEVSGDIPAKGASVVDAIREMGIYIEPMGVTNGDLECEADRWREAGMFLFPSHYEGNSYALLEAMACQCIPIAYHTGIVPDLPPDAGEFTDDHDPVVFAHLIEIAQEKEHGPVMADYNLFAKDWRAYLECES